METSTLGKVIQSSAGTTNDIRSNNDVNGIYGLESLCKVFGSAEYLERKMSDWSDDIFFLELWDELQDRARSNSYADGSVGRDLTTSEVASRTSATITQSSDLDGAESDGGALFDETATAYRRLKVKAEEQINDLLVNAITSSLRPYSRGTGWSSLSSQESINATNSNFAPSSTLDTSFQLLSDFLTFLSTVLAPTPLKRITRQLCLAMQRYIWDNVLMRHNFSANGVQQLRGDIQAIEKVIDASTKFPGEAARGMRRLGEALKLLGLPIKPSSSATSTNKPAAATTKEGDDGWEFDEDRDDDDDKEIGGAEDEESHVDETEHEHANKIWSLWEVEKRVFKSNESARNLLMDMGLETLSESDARGILERRVEVGS